MPPDVIAALAAGYVLGCLTAYLFGVRAVERRQARLLEECGRPETDFRKTLPEIKL